MRSRNTIIIAGALFVAPLATAAFRSPSPNRSPLVSVTMQGISTLPGEDHQVSTGKPFKVSISKPANGASATGKVQEKKKINGKQRQNAAMSDPAFLRKRTLNLLRITANGFPGEKMNRSGTMKIDKKTFDWLIDAWAYSGQSDSSEIALALLNRMEEMSNPAYESVPKAKSVHLDSKTYTKVLKAIALSGKADAGDQAERLLNRMIGNGIRPNTLTYTYVIDAHSRSTSPDSPMHAQRLVEQMETLRASGDNKEIKPTARAWNSVIKSWSSNGDASKASACLDIMESLADNTGNEEVRPNSYNCNSVISAWAKSGEPSAASKAERILEKMERMYASSGEERFQPTTETYNAVVDAWAKSGQIDAPNRAELLLGYMMELYETGHNTAAKPNVRSFNSVMNAWAKSGDVYAPEKAADILRRMEDLGGDLRVKPDATSFATVINAYARSLNYRKADAAYDLFLKINKMYDLSGNASLKPNNIVYNSVLNACAFTIGDIEEQCRAIEIANEVFTAMKESNRTKPDEVTYGTYLKVITNQMPVGIQRDKVVRAIFEKASQDGMVGTLVLHQLKAVGLDSVLDGRSIDEVSLDDLPNLWTCNVKRQ